MSPNHGRTWIPAFAGMTDASACGPIRRLLSKLKPIFKGGHEGHEGKRKIYLKLSELRVLRVLRGETKSRSKVSHAAQIYGHSSQKYTKNNICRGGFKTRL